jgi:hypothetical protein
VRAAEADRIGGSTALTETVARYLFKLMAYKDEYEVARLYTSGDFQRRLQQQFEGDYQLRFHLAPPLFAKKDEQGRLLKKEYGPWMFKAFGLLAKLKFLRGGRFDVFGRTAERRMERKLIGDYEATVQVLLDGLDDDRLALAVEIASTRAHPRLRPRQGSAFRAGQGARSGPAGAVAQPEGAAYRAGGLKVVPAAGRHPSGNRLPASGRHYRRFTPTATAAGGCWPASPHRPGG